MSARVVLVAALLLGVAVAFDFTSMAPAKITDLGKHWKAEHHLDKEFTHAESGRKTFVKLNAEVQYHKKWNFVQLSDHAAPGVMGKFQRCHISSDAKTTFSIKAKDEAAKVAILGAVAKPSAILLARDLRCNSRGIFGHYANHTVSPVDKLNVTFEITNAQFSDVFKHADVQFRSNHFMHRSFTPDDVAELLQKWNDEDLPSQDPQHRAMKAQHHHWFHHIVHDVSHDIHHVASHVSKDVSHVAHKVEHTAESAGKDIQKAYTHVTKAVKDVGNDVHKLCNKVEGIVTDAENLLEKADKTLEKVVSLMEGNLNVDKSWTLLKMHWGTASLMQTYFTPAPTTTGYKLDHYGSFELIVHFQLKIASYKVLHVMAALEGDAEAAIAASATGKYSASYNKQVADIRITPINFAIGPVPVHIQTYIPVHVGASIKAGASIQFGAQATGKVEYGVQYTSGQFSTIHNHKFTFTHKFTEPTNPTLALTASVTPSVVIQIDCIGGPIASIRMLAQCNLVNNDELVITAQPIASISAQLKIAIKGHTILGPKTLGPYTRDGTVYHLATIKIPNLNPFAKKSERFNALAAIGQNGNSEALSPSIGSTFRGARIVDGVTTEASFQIVGGSNSTIELMAVITSSSQKGFSTIVVPYTMGQDVGSELVYLRPNISEAVGTTSDAELSVFPPSFEDVSMSQISAEYTTLSLNDQVAGNTMADDSASFNMDNKVYSSTESAAPKSAATINGAADSSAEESSGKKYVVYGASGAAVIGLVAVVAFVAVRASKKAVRAVVPNTDNADTQAMV